LLHDDTLDLTDRTAGCVLLYGQQLSRTAAMTTSQITTRDGTCTSASATTTFPVSKPLGIVLTELVRTGRSHIIRVITTPTCSSVIFRGAPGLGASASPSTQPTRNRTRHLRTGSRDTPVRAATAVNGATPPSSAQASTIRARRASDCDTVRLRTSASSDARSHRKQQRDKLRARHAQSLLSAHIFLTQDTREAPPLTAEAAGPLGL
jgi:hypothetical protein